MSRRSGRPEQLHLQLQWNYLNYFLAASEGMDSYEVSTQVYLGETLGSLASIELHPILAELNRISYNH